MYKIRLFSGNIKEVKGLEELSYMPIQVCVDLRKDEWEWWTPKRSRMFAIRCNDCRRYFAASQIKEGSSLCVECASVHCVKEPEYKPMPIMFGNKAKKFGIELEMDTRRLLDRTRHAIAYDIIDACDGMVYVKGDYSLSPIGIEVVTHPCDSLNKYKDVLKTITSIAAENGYDSGEEVDTCGFHVHVSRTGFGSNAEVQNKAIETLVLLVDTLYENLRIFSRRRDYELSRWAANPLEGGYNRENKKTMAKRQVVSSPHRYFAVNCQNNNTIEFRLFRGSLNADTLIASMQLVDILVELSKTLDADSAIDYTWDELMDYASTNYPQYVEFTNYCNSMDV